MIYHKGVVSFSGGLRSAATLAIALRDCEEVTAVTVVQEQRHLPNVPVALSRAFQQHYDDQAIRAGVSCRMKSSHIPSPHADQPEVQLVMALQEAKTKGSAGEPCNLYSGFSDHLDRMDHALRHFTRTEGCPFITPVATYSLTRVIRMCQSLGVPLALTFSCTQPMQTRSSISLGWKACGKCDSCLRRREAFDTLAMDDPSTGVVW